MNRNIYGMFIFFICIGCLTSCGSTTSVLSNSKYSTENVKSYNESTLVASGIDAMEGSSDYVSVVEPKTTITSEADIVKSNMMIVRNADLSVDVANLEQFTKSLEENVNQYEGYFESSTVNNYESDYSTTRYAYYTVRIPEKSLDSFLGVIDGDGTVTSKTITSEDVSLEYVDVEARINALEKEKSSLLSLLDKADNVSDMIEIQNRLSDVQYELDSKNNQKRTLEGRVNFSTVQISAKEERNVAHPIRRAFEINFGEKMIEGIENAVGTFVGIITTIPVIIIITTFFFLFIWVVRKVWTKIFKRKDGIRYMLLPVDVSDVLEAENKDPKNSDVDPEIMNESSK